MFLLLGINGKVKDCGPVPGAACPVCGSLDTLRACNKYMTPTIFFIPTFHFHSSYIVTCGHCASVMELNREKGRAVARGQPVAIFPGDMTVVQDNMVPFCSRCGGKSPRGSSYCNRCGSPL